MGVIEALQAYNRLLTIEYCITVGRKNKTTNISIVFDKLDWFHTMGLHYLKDLEFLSVHGRQTERLYASIINGEYKNNQFENSRYYTNEMMTRIDLFGKIEAILDNLNNTEYNFYSFDAGKCPGTKISADFLINNRDRFENLMLYTKAVDFETIRIGEMSVFSSAHQMRDYSKGQMGYTVLENSKLNHGDNSKELIYRYPKYIENIENKGLNEKLNSTCKSKFHTED